MADWQALVSKMVKDAPLEPVYFCIRSPQRKPWPKTLPSTASLIEFYSLCDGGNFSAIEVLPLETIKTQLPTMLRAIDLAAIAADPERIFIFGFNSRGFVYFVDTDNDLVSGYNPRTNEWEHHNQSFDSFMEDLFTPGSAYSDDSTEDWVNVLRQVGNLT